MSLPAGEPEREPAADEPEREPAADEPEREPAADEPEREPAAGQPEPAAGEPAADGPEREPAGPEPAGQPDLPGPQPTGEAVAWSALGSLLSGPLVWGGLGYVADRALGTEPALTIAGVVLGAATAFYIVYVRFGRDQ